MSSLDKDILLPGAVVDSNLIADKYSLRLGVSFHALAQKFCLEQGYDLDTWLDSLVLKALSKES